MVSLWYRVESNALKASICAKSQKCTHESFRFHREYIIICVWDVQNPKVEDFKQRKEKSEKRKRTSNLICVLCELYYLRFSSSIEDNNFGYCVCSRCRWECVFVVHSVQYVYTVQCIVCCTFICVCVEFLSHRILTPCISIFFNGLSFVDDYCWFSSLYVRF